MKIYNNPPREEWKSLCERPLMNQTRLIASVKDIVRMVMLKGDNALKEYAKKYDKANLKNIRNPWEGVTVHDLAGDGQLIVF